MSAGAAAGAGAGAGSARRCSGTGKMIAFSSDCLPHPSQMASVTEAYARSMLGRSPVGGSFVSLIEFWSTYI